MHGEESRRFPLIREHPEHIFHIQYYLQRKRRIFGNRAPKDIVPLDVTRLKAKLLKDPARRPGRKFDLNAKRRSDYAAATIKALAEKSSAKAGQGKPYAVGTVDSILSLFRRIASFGVIQQLCQGLTFTTHKDPKTTARYAHLRDEVLRNGSNVMGRIVKEGSETA